jgi:hypothetical protein
LLYIYNRRNDIGGDTKLGNQPPNTDVLGHLRPRWEPRIYRMQIHLWLKMKVSGGRHSPVANTMRRHLPDSCREAKSLLTKT